MQNHERMFRGFKAFAQGFFIGVPLCLTVTDNFCTVCQVEGVSMQPVLNFDSQTNDFVLINRWKAKQFDKIERGDVVSIISPKDPSTLFIKRIIALEGDKIRTLSYKNRIVRIPRGHCWIEGDNRKHSLDSNSFGSVPLGLVNGVATRIIWPPSRWTKLSNKIPPGRNPFHITSAEPFVEKDGNNDVKNEIENKNMLDIKETTKLNVDNENCKVHPKPEREGSSNVMLRNGSENTQTHASNIISVEAAQLK